MCGSGGRRVEKREREVVGGGGLRKSILGQYSPKPRREMKSTYPEVHCNPSLIRQWLCTTVTIRRIFFETTEVGIICIFLVVKFLNKLGIVISKIIFNSTYCWQIQMLYRKANNVNFRSFAEVKKVMSKRLGYNEHWFVKALSQRAKAKIFFDVCQFFFTLFTYLWSFSLLLKFSFGVNRP